MTDARVLNGPKSLIHSLLLAATLELERAAKCVRRKSTVECAIDLVARAKYIEDLARRAVHESGTNLTAAQIAGRYAELQEDENLWRAHDEFRTRWEESNRLY